MNKIMAMIEICHENSTDDYKDNKHDHHHDSLWAIFMTWHIVQVLKILSDSAVPFTEDPYDDDDDCVHNNHRMC